MAKRLTSIVLGLNGCLFKRVRNMVGRVCCRSFFFFCYSKCVRFFRLEGHLSNLTFQVWIHAFSIKNIHRYRYRLSTRSKFKRTRTHGGLLRLGNHIFSNDLAHLRKLKDVGKSSFYDQIRLFSLHQMKKIGLIRTKSSRVHICFALHFFNYTMCMKLSSLF